MSAPENFNGRHQNSWIDPRALDYVDRERDRDRQQRFHWREQPRVHYETGQFTERLRSPLRYPPRDFSPPRAPSHQRFAQPDYGRPDYRRYEKEAYRHERERDFRYSREEYGSRWSYFEAGPQYQDDYRRDDEGPASYIQPDWLEFEQGEEEEEEPPKLDGFMQRRAEDKDRLKAVNASEEPLVTTQLKIMAIAPPLIDLYTRVLALEEGKKKSIATESLLAVLQQWAGAYHHITKQRRRTVVSLIEPSFDFLSTDPEAFAAGREARELLFTPKFLESMLREASQDATLAASSRTRPVNRRRAGPTQSSRGPGFRELEQSQQDSHDGVGCRGGRPQYSSSWLRGGNSVPCQIAMSREMKEVCDTEVRELLAKQAIVEVTDGSHGFVCSLFVIPKKSGGFRPIVNLKPLNQFIQYEHFKMENLDSARFLLRKGDWMVKLDLKDAYLTIPVHPSHQKFLRFKWKGRIFQFKCLAFGLAPAPRIFTKILKAVMGFLRKQGMRLIIYLDDILILNRSKEGAAKDFKQVIDLLLQLGFLINWEKTVADPTQKLEYLGLMLDSCRLSFALPSAKALAVKSMCESALAMDSISLREIASIMGNFTWAIPAIPFAQAHFRSMQRFCISRAWRAGYDLKTKCILSAGARLDLQWWISSLKAGELVVMASEPGGLGQ
ncbi:Uncharacterized protein APZ42_014437, partial [Daphnia magna]